MHKNRPLKNRSPQELKTILAAVDFSDCSRYALQKAVGLLGDQKGRIVALHVIDHHFINECTQHQIGDEHQIKARLFLDAEATLRDFIQSLSVDGIPVEAEVCAGEPFIEINNRAVSLNADMVVIGSRGMVGDMESIFFGSTAEKILRFIKRPVLCVPPEFDYRE